MHADANSPYLGKNSLKQQDYESMGQQLVEVLQQPDIFEKSFQSA